MFYLIDCTYYLHQG